MSIYDWSWPETSSTVYYFFSYPYLIPLVQFQTTWFLIWIQITLTRCQLFKCRKITLSSKVLGTFCLCGIMKTSAWTTGVFHLPTSTKLSSTTSHCPLPGQIESICAQKCIMWGHLLCSQLDAKTQDNSVLHAINSDAIKYHMKEMLISLHLFNITIKTHLHMHYVACTETN